MTKAKVTITVDRAKIGEAQQLTGAALVSAAIDVALDRLIRAERLRRDIDAYAATPPTGDEAELGGRLSAPDDLADDTDWASLYEDA